MITDFIFVLLDENGNVSVYPRTEKARKFANIDVTVKSEWVMQLGARDMDDFVFRLGKAGLTYDLFCVPTETRH